MRGLVIGQRDGQQLVGMLAMLLWFCIAKWGKDPPDVVIYFIG